MKHVLAIAVSNGFTAALAAEVENGSISLETARQLTRFATSITREYLKGNKMFGKGLEFFASDGEKWDDFIKHDKINMQRWGGIEHVG